jgi:integrase
MKWADFDGARIYVVQEKTGKKMWLNCPKPLLAALKREQRKTNSEFMFLNAHGNPYASAQVLSHVIRHRLESLKIEGYTTHGLRKNAGMELAEAGCTVLEVMAVLGHKTPKMAMFYCEQAQQKRMNESAVGKWDAAIEKRAVKDVEKKRAALRVVS